MPSGRVCPFWIIVGIKKAVKFLFGPYMVLCGTGAETMGRGLVQVLLRSSGLCQCQWASLQFCLVQRPVFLVLQQAGKLTSTAASCLLQLKSPFPPKVCPQLWLSLLLWMKISTKKLHLWSSYSDHHEMHKLWQRIISCKVALKATLLQQSPGAKIQPRFLTSTVPVTEIVPKCHCKNTEVFSHRSSQVITFSL